MEKRDSHKMRVSFDLDEVLFVDPSNHRTEPPLPFPFNRIFKERLRLGTPELIRSLQALGYDVWIYTSSFRSERYIKFYFLLYRVRFDGIVNATRHLREVQGNRKERREEKIKQKDSESGFGRLLEGRFLHGNSRFIRIKILFGKTEYRSAVSFYHDPYILAIQRFFRFCNLLVQK